MTDKVHSKVERGIGWLMIDNPERRNAISAEMGARGAQIISEFESDSSVHIVAIASKGNVWSAGADINDFNENSASGAPRPTDEQENASLYDAVYDCPKPVVAVVQGHCFGGAVALACACDLRIASAEANFAITAARIAIGYPLRFTHWIVNAVGPAYAAEMLLTAKRYTASDAHRIGLVHTVTPASDFANFSSGYLEDVAKGAPLSQRASKAIIRELASGRPVDKAKCQALLEICRASDDHAEGRRAFAEKRAPVFVGR